MAVTAQSIFDNLKAAHPEDNLVVYKYTRPGGASSYFGTQLLNIDLNDDEVLTAYKLSESSGPWMNEAEIKSKAFPFVYDTRSVTDNGRRRTILKVSLKVAFPNHYVNVFIFGSGWSRNNRSKGAAAFKNEYGSDVDIVLS
ncbi:unnamed protein product [Adineta ricciae]|uniref:Uncharacterized protein n=1 Tax=Adineta ricciae TaxID=249248 RepID=A0A815YRD6_ADIRI|nr:unnamed protein product [Adineta ricciae]CAF1573281.1 unnamed protein product [Adineta ricciae]